MKLGWRLRVRCALGTLIAGLLAVSVAYGQAGTEAGAGATQKPLMAEDVFKNVQVLRGIPVKEFMETMGFFAASLSLNCVSCHIDESASEWSRYADDTPIKQTTRRMVVMVNALNKGSFAGARKVTCYSCHRGSPRPEVVPSLAEQYAAPPEEDPDKVEARSNAAPKISADQILDRYIQALGGAQQLAKLTSFTAKGTYSGFDTDFGKVPTDVFAKAPNQRTTVIHLGFGDSTTTYDGQEAWAAAPVTHSPVPVLPLTGDDLQGAAVDAMIAFPERIKDELSNWRAGFPEVTINDRNTQVIEGTTAGGARVKFYFDQQTGLLVRQARTTSTIVGVNPTHIEYSDYREVAGVKIPFQWTVTWTDGQSTIELTDVQPNAPIDAARFAKPAAPMAKSAP